MSSDTLLIDDAVVYLDADDDGWSWTATATWEYHPDLRESGTAATYEAAKDAALDAVRKVYQAQYDDATREYAKRMDLIEEARR